MQCTRENTQVWQARRVYIRAIHPGIQLPPPTDDEDFVDYDLHRGSGCDDDGDDNGTEEADTTTTSKPTVKGEAAGAAWAALPRVTERLFASAVMSIGRRSGAFGVLDKEALMRVYDKDPIIP
jgi:hypothetical protein